MARDQAPLLPATVRLRARPYLCDPAGTGDWAHVPTDYHADVQLADLGLPTATGTDATLGLRDAVHAIYGADGSGPSNKDAIDALAKLAARDRLGPLLAAYDRAYQGVVAPAPDATVGAIAWTYRADGASTRMATEPTGGEATRLGHSDAADDCPDCVVVYPAPAKVSGGTVTLPKKKLCLERGELVERDAGPPVSFPGCCESRCDQPVQVPFAMSRCFYTAPPSAQPVDIPTLEVAGQSVAMTYTRLQPTFSATVVVPGDGVYPYTVTSASTFDHHGSFTVRNCVVVGSTSGVLKSKVIRFHLPGCGGAFLDNALIRGGSISLAFDDGSAGGSGTTGDDGYAYIRLGGSEPGVAASLVMDITAPYYKPFHGATSQGVLGLCDFFVAMEPVDCYDCFENAGNYQAGQDFNPVTPYVVGDDPGCRDPQPLTGTFTSPWGSACLKDSWATSGPGHSPVLLGHASGMGLTYTAVPIPGNEDGATRDVTCDQVPHQISFPIYAVLGDHNQVVLRFAAKQRCDPDDPHDRCTYPVEGDPTDGTYAASITVTLVHDPGTCNPAVLEGTFPAGLYRCLDPGNGNFQGAAYDFLQGATFTYRLDNCGCDEDGDQPANPYGSNPYATAQARPPRRAARPPRDPDADTVASLDPAFAAELAARRPPVAEMLRLLGEVRACPHRAAPACGCPSVPGACALGKGGARGVTQADCIACRRDDAVTLVGHLNGFSGYGQQFVRLGMELERLGRPVALAPLETDESFLPLDEWAKGRAAR